MNPCRHLLRNDIQNELLRYLSRDGGEADQPVFPWVLLLALFEDWIETDFPPVLTSPVLYDLSKVMESGSAMTSTSSLSFRGRILLGPMDL